MSVRFRLAFAGILVLGLLAPVTHAGSTDGLFRDVPDSHTFAGDIAWLAVTGVTRGCNPPMNDRFCPGDHVTRGQMAAFLTRAMGYTEGAGSDRFTDDDDSIFESDIERIAAAGVTYGCNPPDNDRFCPSAVVTREQMASFLVRALQLAGDETDAFVDDNDSVHELSIDRLHAAGLTFGCNPPQNDRFCPRAAVTRGAMAAFLHRALGGAVLGGYVFEDADLDGRYESTEEPLGGIVVELSGPTLAPERTTTRTNGSYTFGPLQPGRYVVELVSSEASTGALATTEVRHVVDVVGDTAHLDLDIGLRTARALQHLLVGAWVGTNTNPWTDPYDIEIEFGSDGVYSAHTDAENSAIYFGPDSDTRLKTYSVDRVRAGGVGSGRIAFVWVEFVTPTIRMGEMRSIEFLGPDRVEIEIWDGGYGPVVLDLVRSSG